MKFTDTSEKAFQKLIANELIENGGYVESVSNDFDKEFCVNKEQLLSFIEQTQPEKYEMLQRKGERAFLVRLDHKIKKLGVIEVLRKGVKHFDKTIDLFYRKPSSSYNYNDLTKYQANIFAVTQELVYSSENKNRLDLTLFFDYRKEDFTKNGESYDVILEVAGKSSFSRGIRSLNPNGRYLLANPRVNTMLRGLWVSMTSSKNVIIELAGEPVEDLIYIAELVEAGTIKSVIDKRYPLEELAEAHRYVDTGDKAGNVVITVKEQL